MIRAGGLLVVAATLSACAGMPGTVSPDQAAWELRRDQLTSAQTWDIKGRISLRNAEDGYSGGLDWAQKGDELDFRFRGPLGVGGFRINGNPQLMLITTSKGEVYEVRDAELDLEYQFGWKIPIHSMRYWVIGIPDPSLEFDAVIDEDGRASLLDQQDWQIEYKSYRRYDGQVLPRRIEMRNADVRIRLAVDRWNEVPQIQ